MNGVRNTVQNTFGESLKYHIDAIEESHQNYVETTVKLRSFITGKNLPNQDDDWKLKKFLYLVMTPYCKEAKNELVPAEFAATIFSFDGGISEAHTGLVDPGYVPFGERGEVKNACDLYSFPFPGTHRTVACGIILPEKILGVLADLANKHGMLLDGEVMIFAVRSEMAMLDNCFRWLRRKSDPSVAEVKFKILSFEILVKEMSSLVDNADTNEGVCFHEGGAAKFIYHARYDFNPLLACGWHRMEERIGSVERCASNISLRRVYNALFYLCHLFQVEVKPGTHLPPKDTTQLVDIKVKDWINYNWT